MSKHGSFEGPGLIDSANPEARGARLVFDFYNGSGSTITDGDAVVLDRSVTTYGLGSAVKVSPAVANDIEFVGIADETKASGQWIRVVVWGLKVNANVASAATAGQGLQTSGTAGRLEARGANETYCATALENSSSNVCDVFVKGLGPSAP